MCRSKVQLKLTKQALNNVTLELADNSITLRQCLHLQIVIGTSKTIVTVNDKLKVAHLAACTSFVDWKDAVESVIKDTFDHIVANKLESLKLS